MNIIIATIKSWNIRNARNLCYKCGDNITVITEKEELNYETVKKLNPDFIFFPHWSWIIPAEVYESFNCVVFHMTDLPFGRGGSPLQNLILRGIEETQISAIKVDGGIDTGEIFLKYQLNLNGTADEIFMRASKIIFNKMIPSILNYEYTLRKQEGEIVEFQRRKPEESVIVENLCLEELYDFIRALDGEDYPKAFITFGNFKMSFSRPTLKSNKIIADVEILELNYE